MNGLWKKQHMWPLDNNDLNSNYNEESSDDRLLKCVDFQGGTPIVTDIQFIRTINLVQQGMNFYQRVGNRIEWRNLVFRANYSFGGVNTFPSNGAWRLAIVYDHQPQTTPGWRDIFFDVFQDGTTLVDVRSNYYWDNRQRFVILYDSLQMVPNCLWSASDQVTQLISPSEEGKDFIFYFNLDLRKLHSIYSDTEGEANICTGAIYLCVWSDQFSSTGPGQPFINARIRLYYYDH